LFIIISSSIDDSNPVDEIRNPIHLTVLLVLLDYDHVRLYGIAPTKDTVDYRLRWLLSAMVCRPLNSAFCAWSCKTRGVRNGDGYPWQ